MPDLVVLYRVSRPTALRLAQSALGEAPAVTVAILGALGLVIILSLYMLADSTAIVARMNRIVPSRYAEEAEILERAVSTVFWRIPASAGRCSGRDPDGAHDCGRAARRSSVRLPDRGGVRAGHADPVLRPTVGPRAANLATAIFNPGWLLVVAPLLLSSRPCSRDYSSRSLMRDALGMHPVLVLVACWSGAQIAGVWGPCSHPDLRAAERVFNYAVNLRTIDDGAEAELDDVLEEVRSERAGRPARGAGRARRRPPGRGRRVGRRRWQATRGAVRTGLPFRPIRSLFGQMESVASTASVADTIEAVYRQEADKLWRALFAFAADAEIASDAVAESFAQAIRRGTAIRDPRAWVWKSGFRIAAGELKRRSRSVDLVPDGSYLDPEVDTELLAALAHLSDGQRAAVVLHYYADASVREISRRTGTSQLSVRANLSRGRKRLKQLLGDRHG